MTDKKIDEGGFVYPSKEMIVVDGVNGMRYERHEVQGITRRDWLAGMALQGQLASMTNAEVVKAMGAMTDDPYAWAAKSAYQYADALIAEGNK